MPWKFNPFTLTLDYYTTGTGGPQNPLYITSTTYFQQVGNTLYLYVNGVIRQEWTTTVVSGSGSPIGLLLALTYP